MNSNPVGTIAARFPDSPISDDEAEAVRLIRYLPQGFNLGLHTLE